MASALPVLYTCFVWARACNFLFFLNRYCEINRIFLGVRERLRGVNKSVLWLALATLTALPLAFAFRFFFYMCTRVIVCPYYSIFFNLLFLKPIIQRTYMLSRRNARDKWCSCYWSFVFPFLPFSFTASYCYPKFCAHAYVCASLAPEHSSAKQLWGTPQKEDTQK